MSAPPEDELLRHAHALRGLARSLVGGQDAEDLVQETAMQAWHRPPAAVESWFGWFGAVLRRRAARHHRTRFRRQRREQAAAALPAEPPPSPFASAAQRETIARLDAALLALPEPYLGTLLQRYYEDRTPIEIAARTGVPIATVKSRLQRGLGMLREQLGEGNDDGQWRAGLVAAFGLDRTGATAAGAIESGAGAAKTLATGKSALATAGMIAMTKWWLGAAAMVLAAFWWWSSTEPALMPPAPVSGSPAVPIVAAEQLLDERVAVPQPTGDAGAVAAVRPTATAELVTFVGRCVDGEGAPIAAAEVAGETRRNDGGERLATAQQATAADGTFVLQLPIAPRSRQTLMIRAEDRYQVEGDFVRSQPGQRIDVGDVVLPLLGTVRGRVVDTAGNPQADVRLVLLAPRNVPPMQVEPSFRNEVTTDAAGRFELSLPAPLARCYLLPGNRKLTTGEGAPFVLTAAQRDLELELVVEPAPAPCRGIVVDEAGLAIANAYVSLNENRATTDRDGRFEVLPDPNRGDGQRVVTATANGYRDGRAAWQPGQAEAVRIVLSSEPMLVIRVLDARTGQPVTRYQVHHGQTRGWQSTPLVRRREHTAGISRVPIAAGNWLLLVRGDDPELAPSPFVPVQVAAGRPNEVTIELAPWSSRRVVVRSGGRPVPGARVQLVDSGDEPLLLDTETVAFADCQISGVRLANLLQQGTTDQDGALVLRGPSGRLALRLAGGGLALQLVQPVQLDAPGDLVIDAPAGASWRGRLLPESVARDLWQRGQPRPNVDVRPMGITLVRQDGSSLLRHSEALYPFAADGSFTIDGIPEGTWHAIVAAGSNYAAASITVVPGQQLQQDLDVQPMAKADVTLQFRVDGVPAASCQVNVMGWHARDVFGKRFASQFLGTTDASGRFQVQTCSGELVVHLLWNHSDGSATLMTTLPVPTAGPQQHLVELQLATLDLQLTEADGSPAADWPLQLAAIGGQNLSDFTTNREGRLPKQHWVAGSYEVRARPAHLRTREQQAEFARRNGWPALDTEWIPLGTIDIAPGPARAQVLRVSGTR
jgi:RNA polymerase sigma-70 factor (ECF subfamily)